MKEKKKQIFTRGMKDGIPIGLGYFAVSFTLKIKKKNVNVVKILKKNMSKLII